MEALLRWIADMAFLYGQYGAGMLSQHGGYETPVPEVLQKRDRY